MGEAVEVHKEHLRIYQLYSIGGAAALSKLPPLTPKHSFFILISQEVAFLYN